MCGGYAYLFTWPELLQLMRPTTTRADELPPRYNVAPTNRATVEPD